MIPGNANTIWSKDAIIDGVNIAPSYDGTLGYYANIEKWWCPYTQNCRALSVVSPTRNTLLFAIPFICPYDMYIDKLSVNCTTAVASSTIRVAIYTNTTEPYTMYPQKLLYSTAALATAATGVKTETITSSTIILLANNLYWAVYATGGGASNAAFRGTVAGGATCFLGLDTGMGTAVQNRIQVSFTYGAFPDYFPNGGTPVTTSIIPIVAMRVRAHGRTLEGNITP